MTDADLIGRLFDFGHLKEVQASQLPALRRSDKVVQDAVQSYQAFFKDTLDDLVLKHHNRTAGTADGDLGPATEELISLPRCSVPDFAGQEANWPTECRQLKTGYSMRLAGLSDGSLRTSWLTALGNWNGALADVKLTLSTDTDPLTHDIYAKGAALPGSTLAWSHLARDRCDVTLEQRYDTTIRWDTRTFIATATHELGHALGAGHLGGSTAVMTPMINAAAKSRGGFPNEQDLRQMTRLGYQVAADPQPELPDQPEDPPTDPSPFVLRGELQLQVDGQTKAVFIVIPKPGV